MIFLADQWYLPLRKMGQLEIEAPLKWRQLYPRDAQSMEHA